MTRKLFQPSLMLRFSLPLILIAALTLPSAISPTFAQPTSQEAPVLCSLAPDLILSQPFEYPGGTSGVVNDESFTELLGTIAYDIFVQQNSPIVSPDFKNIITDDVSNGSRDVVIYIIDDFDTKKSEYHLSHGDYVFQVAMQLLDATLGNGVIQPSSGDLPEEVSYLNGQLVLKQIRVEDYDVHSMINQLKSTIPSNGSNETHAILNMSFAVLPCALIQDIIAWPQGLPNNLPYGRPDFPSGAYIVPYPDAEATDGMPPSSWWRVVRTDSTLSDAGIVLGDIITVFDNRSLDPRELYHTLMAYGEGDWPLITLSTQRGTESRVRPIDLYLAVLGDSVARRLTENVLVAENRAIEDIVPSDDDTETAKIIWNIPPREWAARQTDISDALIDLFNNYPEIHQSDVDGESSGLSPDKQAIEPLKDAFSALASPSDVFVYPVAAAGNFDGARPQIPGRWDNVISVSANIVKGEIKLVIDQKEYNARRETTVTRWPDSNSGEMMAPGGWYWISCDLSIPEGEQTRCVEEYVSGTSFAAPAASVLIAMSLLNPSCPGSYGGYMDGQFEDEFFKEALCD